MATNQDGLPSSPDDKSKPKKKSQLNTTLRMDLPSPDGKSKPRKNSQLNTTLRMDFPLRLGHYSLIEKNRRRRYGRSL